MKVKCPYCEKIQNGKRISSWTRKHLKNDYRDPRYTPDDDGDDLNLVGFGKYVVIQKYYRVIIPFHKRGLLKRHKCQGSGKKKIVGGRRRKVTE